MHPDFPAKWKGKTWNVGRDFNWVKHQWVGGEKLTPDDIGPFYESIKTKGEVHPGLLGEASIGRKADRALQLLRQAGLIEYSGKPKAWRVREAQRPEEP